MRKFRTAILAGGAAVCLVGTAMAASTSHIMSVELPDGSVARIEYQGDVAPRVKIDPTPRFSPVGLADPLDAAPLAMFDRIFADMDRQAAAMFEQAQALQAQPLGQAAKSDLAAFGGMPAGTVSYSFVSTSDGSHSCTRSWQMTAQGPNQQPKLVSASSGDCDSSSAENKAGRDVASPTQTPGAHAGSAGTI